MSVVLGQDDSSFPFSQRSDHKQNTEMNLSSKEGLYKTPSTPFSPPSLLPPAFMRQMPTARPSSARQKAQPLQSAESTSTRQLFTEGDRYSTSSRHSYSISGLDRSPQSVSRLTLQLARYHHRSSSVSPHEANSTSSESCTTPTHSSTAMGFPRRESGLDYHRMLSSRVSNTPSDDLQGNSLRRRHLLSQCHHHPKGQSHTTSPEPHKQLAVGSQQKRSMHILSQYRGRTRHFQSSRDSPSTLLPLRRSISPAELIRSSIHHSSFAPQGITPKASKRDLSESERANYLTFGRPSTPRVSMDTAKIVVLPLSTKLNAEQRNKSNNNSELKQEESSREEITTSSEDLMTGTVTKKPPNDLPTEPFSIVEHPFNKMDDLNHPIESDAFTATIPTTNPLSKAATSSAAMANFAEDVFGESDMSKVWYESYAARGSFFDDDDDEDEGCSTDDDLLDTVPKAQTEHLGEMESVNQEPSAPITSTVSTLPLDTVQRSSFFDDDEEEADKAPRISVVLSPPKTTQPKQLRVSCREPTPEPARRNSTRRRPSKVHFGQNPIATEATELWMMAVTNPVSSAETDERSARLLALESGGGVDLSWLLKEEALVKHRQQESYTTVRDVVNYVRERWSPKKETGRLSLVLTDVDDLSNDASDQLMEHGTQPYDSSDDHRLMDLQCIPNYQLAIHRDDESVLCENEESIRRLRLTSPRSALALFKSELCLYDLIPPLLETEESLTTDDEPSLNRTVSEEDDSSMNRQRALDTVLSKYDELCLKMTRDELTEEARRVGATQKTSQDHICIPRSDCIHLKASSFSADSSLEVYIVGGDSHERRRIERRVQRVLRRKYKQRQKLVRNLRLRSPPPPPRESTGEIMSPRSCLKKG